MNVNERASRNHLGPDTLGQAAGEPPLRIYRGAQRRPDVAAAVPLNPGAPVNGPRHRARRTSPLEHILSAAGIFLVLLFLGWMALMVATEESIPPGNPPAVELPTLDPTTLPPCPTEDSNNCYWDATAHGNGQGRSFYTINDQTVLLP